LRVDQLMALLPTETGAFPIMPMLIRGARFEEFISAVMPFDNGCPMLQETIGRGERI